MSYFYDFERMARLVRELTESPALRALREFDRYRLLVEPASVALVRDLQQQMDAARRFIPQIAAANVPAVLAQYELIRSIPVLHDYGSAAADVARAVDAYQNIGLPAVEAFSSHIRAAVTTLAAAERFRASFAGELFERLRGVVDASEDDAPATADELTGFIEQRIARSKRGPISTEGYIQILLAILFFLQQWIASQRMQARFESRLDAIESRLRAVVPAEQVQRPAELKIVTARQLRVRNGPKAEGPVRALLPANALVRVLEQKKGWARVEYFDFLNGDSSEGWVASRYLRSLPSGSR